MNGQMVKIFSESKKKSRKLKLIIGEAQKNCLNRHPKIDPKEMRPKDKVGKNHNQKLKMGK